MNNLNPLTSQPRHDKWRDPAARATTDTAPWTVACTFDAGGDLTLVLETNPYLPDMVIAALTNDFKGRTHALRVLQAPAATLPNGSCGLLSSLDTDVEDPHLRAGLDRLLDDCAPLLTGPVPGHTIQPLAVDGLTVSVGAGRNACRALTVHDTSGRMIATTFLNVPDGWTAAAHESPVATAHAEVRAAAETALRRNLAAERRARANAEAYLDTFGVTSPGLSASPDLTAVWALNGDDCGVELTLDVADPADSWQVLRLLGEWLGVREAPNVTVDLDDSTRAVRATLRGTAPMHLLAWDRARR
ncbi:hypothetical protein AB0N09_05920 [Streptomyces erythrochromogenes]|uniref:hypothetical protein n=1 Tax=Streptomyces erythrochromogenes TaxID=285574 RepID=UPI00341A6C6B